MVDLLQHAAGQAVWGKRKNTKRAKSKVADRGVGNKPFHILLHQANHRPVNNTDERERNQDVHDFSAQRRIARQQWQRKTQESIGSHLQQNTGKNNGTRRGRLGMRVRQPGVERKHRHLDRKRKEESPKQPYFQRIRKTLRSGKQRRNIKRSRYVRSKGLCVVEVESQDRQQHDYRASQRVKEKLDGRVKTPVAAPYADQEIHRHEHHFPENVKEEEVERHEDADHAGLQQQHQNVILLSALLNCSPRGRDRQHAQQRREHHEQHADAVDTQRVFRANRRNPIGDFPELISTAAGGEMQHQWKRNQEAENPEKVSDQAMHGG